MVYNALAAFDLSDFFISRLREESGLWYDLNEVAWEERYVNQAQLTDGESFLSLWIANSPPPYDQSIQLYHNETETLFVAWQTSYDSRREFDESFIRDISASAVARFPSRIAHGRYRLLSFQLTGASSVGECNELVNHHFPDGVLQELPSYSGKLQENLDFELTPDPNAKWFQVMFPNPRSNNCINTALSELVEDINSVELAKCRCYKTSPRMEQLNIDRLCVFGRQW